MHLFDLTKHFLIFVLAALLPLFTLKSFACGFCKTDQGAAVYSLQHKKLAERTHSKYVVVEIQGLKEAQQIPLFIHTLKEIKGIFPNTIKTSFEYKSASFVYSANTNLSTICAEVKRRLKIIQIKPGIDIV